MEENIFKWLDIENQHPNFEVLNEEEIIQFIDPLSDIPSSDYEDQDFEDSRTIRHTDGVQALRNTHKNLEQRSNVTPKDFWSKTGVVGQALTSSLYLSSES